MTTTKKTIDDCTAAELLKLLTDDCELFYLPYCEEEAKIQHFVFRSMILTTLRKRFEEEMLTIV